MCYYVLPVKEIIRTGVRNEPETEAVSCCPYSVACYYRIQWDGDVSFLFGGDAEWEEEHDLVVRGIDLSADVLHVNHHESNSSSSYVYLRYSSASPHKAREK